MTAKQNSLYWREWSAVVRYCKAKGLPCPDRHSLHFAALGRDRSHLGFTNEDLDRVLGEFLSYSRPADLAAQLRQLNGPRIRLKYAINALAPSPEYTARITADRFKTTDLDGLSIEQLTQLRNTLNDRRRAHQRRERAGDFREPISISVNRSLRGTGPEKVSVAFEPTATQLR